MQVQTRINSWPVNKVLGLEFFLFSFPLAAVLCGRMVTWSTTAEFFDICQRLSVSGPQAMIFAESLGIAELYRGGYVITRGTWAEYERPFVFGLPNGVEWKKQN